MSADDWAETTLGNLIELHYGQALQADVRSGSGFPVFGSSGEVGQHSEPLVKGPGVVVGRKGTVGSVRWSAESFWPIDTAYYVLPQGSVDLRWLYWRLSDLPLASLDSSTGVPGLNRNDAYELQLRRPPLPEQRRIAQILDTTDEAIRRTEQVIAKLQQMKQGLIHDLLTRGIDENGELRDPNRTPNQFKDSALGRIPATWEVATVEQLLADVSPAMRSGPFGSALRKYELTSDGVPLLGIDNVYAERFDRRFTRFVSYQKAVELSRYLVRPRDLLITIMGTVGRCALVPDGLGRALSSKHVWTLTFDQTRYSPYLACLQFNYAPWVLAQFRRDEQGGIMSAIRSETLRTLLLPTPPPAEQTAIETVLSGIQQRLRAEKQEEAKLRLLQQGLADDLLSGRVRVPLLQEAPA